MTAPTVVAVLKPERLVVRFIGEGEREGWNEAVASLPTGHMLQTYEWGELKGRLGWQPIRLLFEREVRPVAAACVLKRKVPLGPFSILYAPKGPAVDPADAQDLRSVLDALADLAKRERAIFLRIDPDITCDDSVSQKALAEAGFRPAFEQVQFKNTMVIGLTRPEEELRRRLSKSTRYQTNVAVRSGVTVSEGSNVDLPLFYDMYRETAKRDAFIIRGYDYYEPAWRLFLERRMARLFMAWHDGQALAGCLIFLHGTKAWYMYGASRSEGREARPSQLLHWQVMLSLKEQGIANYDLWGLPNVMREDHPMWGLVQFKRGLGGELRQWIGAYDYVANPSGYFLYKQVLPRFLALWRRMLRLPSAPEEKT
ncbi:MAG: peptidoglycan bridge formation glycyltransferase FemA/FemB family protein [Chloroflexi bacterium]|nr:peptidoglycan bridge formation glycyltransferase FemA/FemB family protein [Chloroflexota bacterium]